MCEGCVTVENRIDDHMRSVLLSICVSAGSVTASELSDAEPSDPVSKLMNPPLILHAVTAPPQPLPVHSSQKEKPGESNISLPPSPAFPHISTAVSDSLAVARMPKPPQSPQVNVVFWTRLLLGFAYKCKVSISFSAACVV